MIDWLADADPALEFDALFEEEHNWFQKSVAEVLS